MRRLLPLFVILAGLGAAAPASAITTVTRADATITITGDDAASVVRVLQQDDLTIAVQAVTGEIGPPPPGCGASDDTVSCQGVTSIVARLGGGVDEYKGSVDPSQTVDGGAGDDVIETGYGKDAVLGGDGNDDLNGFRGDDTLDGQVGDDKVDGWDGSDTVTGGPGKDNLLGDGATIYAPGNDTIQARDGEVDAVDCGTGADSAVVDTADTVSACASVDRPAGPGPGTGPGPDPTPVTPVVNAKARKAPKLGKVARGAAVKLEVTASASCTAKVRLRVAAKQAKKLGFAEKAKTLGTSTTALTAGKPTRVSVTVKRAFRKKLRKAKRVKATLAVSCGTGATDTVSVTLKR